MYVCTHVYVYVYVCMYRVGSHLSGDDEAERAGGRRLHRHRLVFQAHQQTLQHTLPGIPCMYVYLYWFEKYVYMYALYICMNVCIYVCMHVCVNVCMMYVGKCMYICTICM